LTSQTTTATWENIFEAVEALYDLGWTDGLPILPPTTDKVAEFLAAGGRDGAEIVGELPERRREITAEKVAANAVMAGCRPEYMPVVLAATEAMLAPPFIIGDGQIDELVDKLSLAIDAAVAAGSK